MCWVQLSDGGPGFSDISPEVRRSRKVSEVIWVCNLYEGTCSRVLAVLLLCRFELARVGECSNREKTEVKVIYIKCGVEKRGEGKSLRREDTSVRRSGRESMLSGRRAKGVKKFTCVLF